MNFIYEQIIIKRYLECIAIYGREDAHSMTCVSNSIIINEKSVLNGTVFAKRNYIIWTSKIYPIGMTLEHSKTISKIIVNFLKCFEDLCWYYDWVCIMNAIFVVIRTSSCLWSRFDFMDNFTIHLQFVPFLVLLTNQFDNLKIVLSI